MPVNEVVAKVNRELKSLRPLVEERLLFLQKSDRLLQVLYETTNSVVRVVKDLNLGNIDVFNCVGF